MIAPARLASFDILSRIESRAAFSDYLLNSARMAAMSARDRNLTTEIVYGTLRWQGLIDHVIMKTSSRPELDPGVRILLRMSVYQMFFMDRVPAPCRGSRRGRNIQGSVSIWHAWIHQRRAAPIEQRTPLGRSGI